MLRIWTKIEILGELRFFAGLKRVVVASWIMGSGEVEDLEGGTPFNAGGGTISCSICLEVVSDSGDRSTAKLQCGHQFHLDCIGSAFNAKGAMQCPNCRKVEKGQWLFANGYRAFADFGMDEWAHDEDLYDLSYSEIPFGVHWCPFRGFTQLSSSFEDADPSSSAYQDLFGHHAIFPDHASASTTTHACPYLALHAYVQPVHQPSSSSNSDSVADVSAFHHHWAGLSGLADITASHGFPGTEIHHHNWEPHSPPFSPTSGIMQSSDQASAPTTAQRSTRVTFDSDGLPRVGAFLPPFLFGHGSSRAGSSVMSSGLPPYVVNSRGHARIHAYQQQTSPAVRGAFPMPTRRSATRSLAPVPTSHLGTAAVGAAPLDHGGFYSTVSASNRNRPDGESSGSRQNHGHGWERERFAPFPWVPVDGESHWWGPFHHGQAPTGTGAGGPDAVHRNVQWLYAGVDRVGQAQASASGAGGSDSVSRSSWWPSYSSMDRAGQGQPPAGGVGTSDSINRSNAWQLYVDRGQGRTESPYQHHVRLSRMPPFM